MEEEARLLLYDKFLTVNNLHQELNDILGPDETELDKDSKLKLRIPRGYIRPVYDFRIRLGCIKDRVLQYNIAYQLQLSDFYSWILTRTDVGLSVREMLIKYEIVLMCSIAEALTILHVSKRKSFERRIKKILGMGKISQDTFDELTWLWNARNSIHLYKLDHKEFNKYKDFDFNRAVEATRKFLQELNRC